MKRLVVDAGVLVAAADIRDSFSAPSRSFLDRVIERSEAIDVPATARVELACALARRLRNKDRARQLTDALMRSVHMTEHALDDALLESAAQLGTRHFLRAGDALYAAVADRLEAMLVTWDPELLQRTGGITPEAWISRG